MKIKQKKIKKRKKLSKVGNNEQQMKYLCNMGVVFQGKGRIDEAIACYHEALRLNPSDSNIIYNLGSAFHKKGKLDEAISYYQKAIQFNPNHAIAYNNLGSALQEKRNINEAISCYKKAIKFNSKYLNAYNNLGLALYEKMQLEEAKYQFKRVLHLKPDHAEANFNLSGILLLQGHLEEGWKKYEWRRRLPDFQYHNFHEPLWNGSNISGCTVLIYNEKGFKGFGDTIQFIRYVPLIAKSGAKVIVECQKELTALLENIEGVKKVIAQGERLPQFDFHCPLMSLPFVFNSTLQNIPSKVPYINLSSTVEKKWKYLFERDTSQLKIGLVWSAEPRHKRSDLRSFPLQFFSPLLQLDNITFYSLQKGNAAEETENLSKGLKLIDFTEQINDFSDTAAIIQNLDLVISVDTAVAHLAGALGKKVWTLLSFIPCWRWLLKKEDSPWYPTMKLFRQPAPGDWESVIEKVQGDLLKLLRKI